MYGQLRSALFIGSGAAGHRRVPFLFVLCRSGVWNVQCLPPVLRWHGSQSVNYWSYLVPPSSVGRGAQWARASLWTLWLDSSDGRVPWFLLWS